MLNRAESKIEERRLSDAEGTYKVAQAYAVLGDNGSALRQLRESIDGGFLCQPYVVHDPLLQSNRNQPEFQNLMAQASHPHEQFKATFF